ncbi:MAG: DUF115 domain-containing protein [Spirochaetaceae bacterium]|jgi:hypothetical protein|nr:DUF115 domain-containing protein [Spirochaetaceae bacterium]
MNRQYLFERNLLALAQKNPALCSRLSGAVTTNGRYRFLDARSGDPVPALADSSGAAHPLHSLMNPRREGERIIAAALGGARSIPGDGQTAGYLVLFGLGGGYCVQAALGRTDIHRLLIVDYDIHGVAELFASREYIHIFQDPRVHILVDPAPEALESFILETYQPALYGGIRVVPLRARAELDPRNFGRAGEAVKKAVDQLAGDYSVQAYFGTRWFSNIIRNLFQAEGPSRPLPPVRRAAVCAAGPSLDEQMPRLEETRASRFVIAADTALPALLRRGLTPDAVVSIDCQHISYYHFMAGLPQDIPLFLDLASPPLLASLSGNPRFFSGGHPLTQYISRYWRSFPVIDTSGANVTYAAVSLAEYLGAENIELYGADFSYPQGKTYARGTYIHPYFEVRQTRLDPQEAQASAFLYRTSSLAKYKREDGSWYYAAPPLQIFRERLEAKARSLDAVLTAIPGRGAPLSLPQKTPGRREVLRLFTAGQASARAGEFLENYRREIAALPRPGQDITNFLRERTEQENRILLTLLPACAAVQRRRPGLTAPEALEAARDYSVKELDAVLKRAR